VLAELEELEVLLLVPPVLPAVVVVLPVLPVVGAVEAFGPAVVVVLLGLAVIDVVVAAVVFVPAVVLPFVLVVAVRVGDTGALAATRPVPEVFAPLAVAGAVWGLVCEAGTTEELTPASVKRVQTGNWLFARSTFRLSRLIPKRFGEMLRYRSRACLGTNSNCGRRC
jgi:hypothetical protein